MTTETDTLSTAADIASEAARIVGGARAVTHGDKRLNHNKIAAVWNGILAAAGKTPAVPLDAHDVANLMEGLKIARRYLGEFNLDDYVDGAGYAACAGEIKAAENAAIAKARSWVEARTADIDAAIAAVRCVTPAPQPAPGWINTKSAAALTEKLRAKPAKRGKRLAPAHHVAEGRRKR